MLVLLGSCSHPLCGCPPADALTGHVVIRGALTAPDDSPVAGASLEVRGALFWTETSPVLSASDGTFAFQLLTFSGTQAQVVDIVVRPIGLAPDTIPDVSVTFRYLYEPADTVTLNHTISN
jgi:hypothetical protein